MSLNCAEHMYQEDHKVGNYAVAGPCDQCKIIATVERSIEQPGQFWLYERQCLTIRWDGDEELSIDTVRKMKIYLEKLKTIVLLFSRPFF